jgi:pyruvate kinase
MVQFYDTCQHVQRCIPTLATDEKNLEDIDTEQEDHNYDEIRYMFMARPLQTERAKVELTHTEKIIKRVETPKPVDALDEIFSY